MLADLNQRVKNLTFIDIKLIQWAVFFAAIIVVKVFPQLLLVDYLILVMLVVACAAKPFYNFWIKNREKY